MKKHNKDTIILERRFVAKDSVIMSEGEEGSCAFLIQSGSVRVHVESAGREVELSILTTGQIFGEMVLMFDEPRTATVTAREDCNLIIITRDTLHQKLRKSDPTVRAILPMLMKRVTETTNVLLKKEDNIDDLSDIVNTIYQNIYASLPANQKQSLQNAVLPPLKDFLDAVKAFKKTYGDKRDGDPG